MYFSTYDLIETTRERRLDEKLEIQNSFRLRMVHCVLFRRYLLGATTFSVKNNLETRFSWNTFQYSRNITR